jgi:hypothetical protein
MQLAAQQDTDAKRVWSDSVYALIVGNQQLDSRTKSDLADSVFHISASLGDTCRQYHVRIIQATYLDEIGMPDSALRQLYWVSDAFDNACDSTVLMLLLANLTNV